MIQAVMLITLGFMVASLIGILLAPSLWSRAARLTRKQLEATLPLSLTEIDAARDQIRATYAVRLRRMETALAASRQAAALQRVENSRLQMQIGALRDSIASLDLDLDERRNASTVLEQTLTRRVPNLEREIVDIRYELSERVRELDDLGNQFNRKEEALEASRKAAASSAEELTKLRQAVERTSVDKSGRLLRRPSQWTLDDYRGEYDRLNLELSKLRQQLTTLQGRDAAQASVIKGELQKLSELILVSAQPRQSVERADVSPPRRPALAELRRDRPVPWASGKVEDATLKPTPTPDSIRHSSFSGAPSAIKDQPSPSPVPMPDPLAVSAPSGTVDAGPRVVAASVPESAELAAAKPSSSPANPTSSLLRGVTAPSATRASPPSLTPRSIEPDAQNPIESPAPFSSRPAASSAYDNAKAPVPETFKADAVKVYSDAKHLQTISELMAKSGDANGFRASGDPVREHMIADEVKRGAVIDIAPTVKTEMSPSLQRAEAAAAGQPGLTLLDRLRGVGDHNKTSDDA